MGVNDLVEERCAHGCSCAQPCSLVLLCSWGTGGCPYPFGSWNITDLLPRQVFLGFFYFCGPGGNGNVAGACFRGDDGTHVRIRSTAGGLGGSTFSAPRHGLASIQPPVVVQRAIPPVTEPVWRPLALPVRTPRYSPTRLAASRCGGLPVDMASLDATNQGVSSPRNSHFTYWGIVGED